jgi:hypothetical protein
MTATTDETWTINGVLLNTYAYNISTLSGREVLPVVRGENAQVPQRRGRIWVPKTVDQVTRTLAMWVRGSDVDGDISNDPTAQFNENLRAIKRLFADTSQQLEIEKKVRYLDGLLTLTGRASHDGGMSPEWQGHRTIATFSVDLVFADPYWYGALESDVVPSGGGPLVNPGDVRADAMTITLTGPLTNPILKNMSHPAKPYVKYTGTIGAGVTVVLDTEEFTALLGSTNVIGAISHAGTPRWMELLPGTNTMTLTGGAGSATVAYHPPYT